MRKNLLFTPLMVAIASGCAAGSLSAQDTSVAVLTGRVTDPSGKPLQGARVLLQSPALLGSRQAPTDDKGSFRFSLLPNGDYSVTYTLDGYIARKVSMRLIAGQTANGSVQLTPIGVESIEIEILGTTAMVDKSDTVVMTTYSSDRLEQMLGGRSLAALSSLVPGINTSLNDPGNLRIRGGSGHSTKTLMDGANVTDMFDGIVRTTNFTVDDLIESVALMQSPVNARYGNTDGGVATLVTSRGSNTWKGSVRLNVGRQGGWQVTGRGYPNREGDTVSDPISANDMQTSPDYQFSVQGPIWKDHITFAYGARLNPTTYNSQTMNSTLASNATNAVGSVWSINTAQALGPAWSSGGYGIPGWGAPQNRQGIFFQNQTDAAGQGLGDVIRKAALPPLMQDPRLNFVRTSKSSRNFFTVFAQINPQHQLEYRYSQLDSTTQNGLVNGNQQVMTAGEDWNVTGLQEKNWNLAYKGIIGSYGVLDANYGKGTRYDLQANASAPTPLFFATIASYIPIDGDWGNHDFTNYFSNGYISSQLGAVTDQSRFRPDAVPNLGSGRRQIRAEGVDTDRDMGGGTTTINANYQHFLSTEKGTHMADVGFQMQKTDYMTRASGSELRYAVPGKIATDLTAADIWNINSYQSAPPAYYAGKYIVYNVRTASYSDVDPWAVSYHGLLDRQLYDEATRSWAPYATSTPFSAATGNSATAPWILPFVNERFGDDPGGYNAEINSFYINDLWTINDNHSVQAGLRLDMFKAYDDVRTFVSYSQPTFRFEYKWDISGDQSRVLNAIVAQYHSVQPVGTFRPMVSTKLNHYNQRFWDQGSAKPYLVDWDQLTAGGGFGNFGLIGFGEMRGTNHSADPGWKAPISTEYSVGLRRNLSIGGYWKITLLYRTFENDYDFYYDKEFRYAPTEQAPNPPYQYASIMKNSEGYEKSYKSVEFEWDIPLHRRLSFVGSYTYSRLMTNIPSIVDGYGGGHDMFTAANVGFNWDWWKDMNVASGLGIDIASARELWRQVAQNGPEHYFKGNLLYDTSSGSVASSFALQMVYTGSGTTSMTNSYAIGYPNEYYPNLIMYPNGGAVPQSSGLGAFSNSNSVSIPWYRGTSNDGWSTTLRYTLAVPLIRKLTWTAIVAVDNPFNHRGYSASAPVPNGAAIRPWVIQGGPNGTPETLTIYNPMVRPGYEDGSGMNWPIIPRYGDVNGLHTGRMPGRSFSAQTGLRF